MEIASERQSHFGSSCLLAANTQNTGGRGKMWPTTNRVVARIGLPLPKLILASENCFPAGDKW